MKMIHTNKQAIDLFFSELALSEISMIADRQSTPIIHSYTGLNFFTL